MGRSTQIVRFALIAAVLACSREAADRRELVLASTTSTDDSGLFDVLLPAFEQAHPEYDVKVVAVGSGEALALGRRLDADVLLVHAPAAEAAFMANGHGALRRPVMSNTFVIAGPVADPAGVSRASRATDAFRRIAAAEAPFISRGDSSGTHYKELELWAHTGLRPTRSAHGWYIEAGQGMGDVLRVASERQAYVLTDRSTLLSLASVLGIEALFERDASLRNPYSVITVAGARNAAGAEAFADWIVSPSAQTIIREYGEERLGEPLFAPAVQPD